VRERPPELSWLKVGSIGKEMVVAGQLDRVPSPAWRDAFEQVVAVAGFGVHPRLEGDVVIAIAEPYELPRAHYAVSTAIQMTTAAHMPPD
jgi:hypothetical protein